MIHSLQPSSSPGLPKALRNNEAVGLLPDHVPPPGQGVWVPFFGKDAYMNISGIYPFAGGCSVAAPATGLRCPSPGKSHTATLPAARFPPHRHASLTSHGGRGRGAGTIRPTAAGASAKWRSTTRCERHFCASRPGP